MQQLVRVRDGLLRRRIDEREVFDRPEPERFEPQQDPGKTRAQDLRLRERGTGGEILFGVQPHASAGCEAAAAARALDRVRLRDRLYAQALHAVPRAIAAHARQSRIDDVTNARHRQRRLGDVRREHDARRLAGLENLALPCRRQPRVQRQQLVAFRTEPFQRVLGVADPAFPRQEHEHVAYRACFERLGRELARGVDDRRREILIVGARAVAHGHGMASARNPHDRRAAEVLGEALGVDRRRRDDDLEVRPLALDVLEIPEHEVDVEAALVRLVDDQRVVGAQAAVAADVVQQDAVRHDLDERRRARLVREPDLEAHGLADAHVELGREPARDGLRRDAPRLRVADQAFDAAPGLEAKLRKLRRLAAARVAADDDDAVRLDRREQLLARRRDRQRIRILEPIARRSPRGDYTVAREAHSRPARASSTRSSAPPSSDRPTSSVPR